MLSQDLRTLHLWWTELVEGRAGLTPEGCRMFGLMLARAVEDAEALESRPVPAEKRGAGDGVPSARADVPDGRAENVVAFVPRPRAGGGSRPGGGSAA